MHYIKGFGRLIDQKSRKDPQGHCEVSMSSHMEPHVFMRKTIYADCKNLSVITMEFCEVRQIMSGQGYVKLLQIHTLIGMHFLCVILTCVTSCHTCGIDYADVDCPRDPALCGYG